MKKLLLIAGMIIGLMFMMVPVVFADEMVSNSLEVTFDAEYNYNNIYVSETGKDTNDGITSDTAFATIGKALEIVNDGGTINIAAGSYVGNFTITKGVKIIGAGQDKTIINASDASYGILVKGNNVTIQDLSLISNGNATDTVRNYGIHTELAENLALTNITVQGFSRTGIDLNNSIGATLTNVKSINNKKGNGIQMVDSKNVVMDGITVSNNAWGGVGIFTSGKYSTNNTTSGIVIKGTNSFGTNNNVYLEKNPGTPGGADITWNTTSGSNVTIQASDFAYAIENIEWAGTIQTRFFKNYQDAIDGAKLASKTMKDVLETSTKATFVPVTLSWNLGSGIIDTGVYEEKEADIIAKLNGLTQLDGVRCEIVISKVDDSGNAIDGIAEKDFEFTKVNDGVNTYESGTEMIGYLNGTLKLNGNKLQGYWGESTGSTLKDNTTKAWFKFNKAGKYKLTVFMNKVN